MNSGILKQKRFSALRNLVSVGVTSEMSFRERTALENLNTLALFFFIFPIVLSVVIARASEAFLVVPFIAGCLISVNLVLLLYLNYLGYYFTAKIVHYIVTLGGLVVNAYYYGPMLGIEFFVFIMFIGAFTFSVNNYETMIFALMACVSYLLCNYFSHIRPISVSIAGAPVIHIVFSVITFIIIYSSLNLLRHENERYQKAIQEKNGLLLLQREELQSQHENESKLLSELTRKNMLITSSIDYAQRLQHSILPSIDDIKEKLPESFVLYKPKDVVSGDFYWFYSINSKIYLAVVDCTGHGVPGALMSMLGSSLLHQIIQSTLADSPRLILKYLDLQLQTILSSSGQQNGDGMDLTLCVIDELTATATVSSTNRPYLLIRNNEVVEYRGPRVQISKGYRGQNDFQDHKIQLLHDDVLYLFTDGITDQFDWQDQKKYSLKRLKNYLIDIHPARMSDQLIMMDRELSQWKGANIQTDDILIMGFRWQQKE
jgi:serine phosphatase RsbU (regulator of sigma subunit)